MLIALLTTIASLAIALPVNNSPRLGSENPILLELVNVNNIARRPMNIEPYLNPVWHGAKSDQDAANEGRIHQHQDEQMKGEIYYVPNAHWVADTNAADGGESYQHQDEQMKGEIYYVPNAHWVAEKDAADGGESHQHQDDQMKGEIYYVPNAHWVAE